MVGYNFVCPEAVIAGLRKQAKYNASVDDLDIFCLCPQLRSRFLKVVMDAVDDAPPPKRKSRLY